jgi:endonuclease/exonuclease/phosphatase family metal-dependent hydrolase
LFRLLTWNIQWGLGCDGRVSLRRIRDVVRALGDPDVVCLQEVAVGFPGLQGRGQGGSQPEELARLFGGYAAFYGPAAESHVDGALHQFGNMLLSKVPVLQVTRHPLPWPADPPHRSMRRMALESVVRAGGELVRVTTTHLESRSAAQRLAHARRLKELHLEACERASGSAPPETALEPFRSEPRTLSALLAGDFNARPSDPVHQILGDAAHGVEFQLVDAWSHLHPGVAHPPTFGIHCVDRSRHPDAPLAFDYVYLTRDLAARATAIELERTTEASDHQPVMVTIR